MVENREPEQSRDHDPVPQNLSRKERVDEKMERQRSLENELHMTTGESAAETQSKITPASAQAPVRDSTSLSALNKNDAEQAADQTSGSTNLFTSMSDEEFQKAKEEQLQKDEQNYQKAKEQLQQIQQNKEQEAQQSSSGTDQDEEYNYGMGQ
jgi:hypothetical protein